MRLTVPPRAKTTRIRAWKNGCLFVSVQAPPVDQKANIALQTFLGDVFQIPQSHIHLISGQASKQKILEIDLTKEEVLQRLWAFLVIHPPR